MANTKNYTEHGGSITHIGGELVLDPGSKVIKNGQEIDIGGGLPPTEGSGKVLVSVNGEWKEQDGYGYTEIGEEILTDETIETLEQYGMICGNFEEPFVIEEDTEYTIWFNGTKYVVTSVYDDVDTLQSYIGDYIIDEDKFDFSRYPFGIGEFGDGLVLVTESAGTYDIAVSVGGAEVVHKINEKYLPSGGGGGGMVVTMYLDTTDMSVSADKRVSEIVNAMKSGVCPVANIIMDGNFMTCVPCLRANKFDVYFGVGMIEDGEFMMYMVEGTETSATSDVWTFNGD